MTDPLEKDRQERAQEAPAQEALPKADTERKGILVLIFLGVFGFFAAAALFASLSGNKALKKKIEKKEPVAVKQPVSIEVVEKPSAPEIQAPIATKKTSAPSDAVAPPMVLTGILFSKDGSLALIDGKVVPEGGTIGGAKVERIGAEEVELSYAGRTFILRSR